MKKIQLILFFFLSVFILHSQNNNKVPVKNKAKTVKTVDFPVRTPIKQANLSQIITDNIAKEFEGYKIYKSYKVEAHKVITYEIHVSKDQSFLVLIYNKDGKFIKKEPIKKLEKKPEPKAPETQPPSIPNKK